MSNGNDHEWLVAGGEGEEDTFGAKSSGAAALSFNSSNMLEPGGASTIQTATFTTRTGTPPRVRQSPDISSASLFTPPPAQPKIPLSTISPSTSRATTSTGSKPRPRPRPKAKTGAPFVSAYDEVASNNSITAASSSTSASSISIPSSVIPPIKPTDPIISTVPTSSSTSEGAGDGYSLDIAERAKMRSRKARDKAASNQPAPKKATYRPSTQDEVIELTSDDELALKPPPKRQRSQEKPVKTAPKAKSMKRVPETSLVDPHSAAIDIPSSEPRHDHVPPSQPPPSTMPTIPPSTPPQPHESSPLSSPPFNPARKRKRAQAVIPEWDPDNMEVDAGINKQSSPSIPEPPPFFASSSSTSVPADSSVAVPEVMPPPTDTAAKGKKPRAPAKGKKKETKATTQAKGKRKGKKQVDEPAEKVPPVADPPLSPVPDSEAEDGPGTRRTDEDNVPTLKTPADSKAPSSKLTARQKGKGRAILSEDDDEADDDSQVANKPASTNSRRGVRGDRKDDGSLGVEEHIAPHRSQDGEDDSGDPSKVYTTHVPLMIPEVSIFQENVQPSSKNAPTIDHTPLKPTPKIASRAFSVAPKSTPMSELIKRVNSRPNSPFANSRNSGTAYSSTLKSSRSLLSKIAPLHVNRRTPPPPLPKPPPPKKTKKQLEMEERIEEELAETVEGWSCMTDEERRDLRRARIDVELGGYD
ncbi:hypothetical protein BV22DRAFT_1127813 [Leucogyrophana mollusca]|uniref:Uncharacterized protein n=1 Tax=Leucogyrophana mollusca TaxID=85980 RepID=A0ACB8BLZ8_9AGAM|nr:hypothetical protein BV22DRAFT_1127813 [Leucogyrophana mollusca]